MQNTNFSIPLNRDFIEISAARNNELTEVSQQIEAQSWLENGHPLGYPKRGMDLHYLSLISADSFIGGTSHDWGDPSLVISHFLDFFNQLKGEDAQPEITALIEGAHKIGGLMNKPYATFAKEIHKQIPKDGIVWIPCGWKDKVSSAHAIILAVDTKNNRVTLFNTGGGVEFHGRSQLSATDPTGVQNWTNRDQCFLTINHCNPSKINSPEFFQFLYEMQNKWKSDPNIVLDADILYKGLKKLLNGTYEKNKDPEKNPLLYIQSQKSGTCSVKSLLAAIYYTLYTQKDGVAKYKRLKFLWQSQALVALMQKKVQPKDKYLIQNIIENMARATHKEPLKSQLSTQEIFQWEATLLDIQNKLTQVETPPLTEIENVRRIPMVIQPLNIQLSTNPPVSVHNKIDPYLKEFKTKKSIPQSYIGLSMTDCMDRLKQLALSQESHPENIGQIYTLYAQIVKMAKEDPKAKLDGYSINLDPIEEHLANPKVIYTNPATHRDLQSSIEYLRDLGKKKQIFKLKKGKICISQKAMKKNPTLQYFSQFLKRDRNNVRTDLEQIQDLLTHPERLPTSVRYLYEAWYYSTAILRSGKVKADFEPKNLTIKASNPLKLAVNFDFSEQNKPWTCFYPHPHASSSESSLTQNELVSGGYTFKGISENELVNRNLCMLTLDIIDIPNRLIAFFSQNMDLLAEGYMCSYLLSQFFRPCLLLNQIKAQPLYLEKLAQFCNNAIDFFIYKGEYNSAMNCLLMSQRINAFVTAAGYKTDFPDLRSKIIDTILPQLLETRQFDLHMEFLRFLVEEISINEESPHYHADLAAYIFFATQKNLVIDDSLKKAYTNQIKNMCDNPLVKERVLQVLDLQKEKYVVNYSKITIYDKNGSPLIGKREEIIHHPFYVSYFKGCDVQSTKGPDGNVTLSSGNKNITVFQRSAGFLFLRNINTKTYFYSSPGGFESTLVNIPGTLWKNLENKKETLLIDEKTDMPCMQFEYSSEKQESEVVSAITRLSDGAKLQKTLTIPQIIHNVWVDKNNEAQEFTYSNLKFSRKIVDEIGRLYCDQHPGYFLVENNKSDNISQPHLTLRNMAGQKILLIENPTEEVKSAVVPLIKLSVVNGILKGISLDDQLFLIEHYLKQNEHQLAYQLIKQLNLLERIENDEKQMRFERTSLKSIFDFLKDKKHPNEQAIYLHLIKLELENRMRFPNKINQTKCTDLYKPDDLKNILNQYKINETNCTFCRLTPKEKLSLNHLLQESYGLSTGYKEWRGRIILPLPPQLKAAERAPKGEGKTRFESSSLVFSAQYFDDHYQRLYEIAASGTAAQKKWLGNVLDCNYAYRAASASYTIIYNKYRWPYIPYPRASIALPLTHFFNSFKSLLGKTKEYLTGKRRNHWITHTVPKASSNVNLLSPPLILNTDSMKKADQAFDAYFKALKNKYFICTQSTQKISTNKLPSKHPSKLVEAKLKQENEDLAYFRTHILAAPQDIELPNLLGLQQDLNRTLEAVSGQLNVMKTALLWKINSGDTFKKIGYGRKLEWKDLQKLSIAGNFELFRKETALDKENAEKILNMVGYYLVIESRVQQMTNILKPLQNAEDLRIDSPKRKLFVHQAFETINLFTSELRNYTQVDRLWFECTNKYLYRENQIKKMQEILDAHKQFPEIQAEMPTGYGKTDNVAPTLSQSMSALGKAVFNCWPTTLEMVNLSQMASQMINSFASGISRLTFDRSSNFTANNLAAIYRSLIEDKENRRPINCCPEAIRALELHFLLTLDSHPVDKKKLHYFIKILSFLRNDAWVTIDEEHVLLSPMDRLIYTLGNPIPIPNRDINIVEKLFDMLLEEPFTSHINLLKNANHSMTEAHYQRIANALAQSFYYGFKCTEDQKEFIAFVTGNQSNEPKWLQKHPKKEEISLVKGLLCFVLQPSLNGSVDENFGFSKEHFDSTKFAISYASANTPNETASGPSQYKNPHETLVKTYITYLYKGLQPDQVKDLIQNLQEKVRLETAQGIPLSKIEAYQIYETFDVPLKKPLNLLEVADIELFAEKLLKNKKVIYQYLKCKVIPQIKVYEESIASDAQNFRSQFASSLSLSATPQTQTAHGPQTHFIPMKGTSGQVTHLLLSKCGNSESIHRMQSTNPNEAVREVLEKVKGRKDIKAVIDIGAQFKGLSNYDIATQLMEDPDPDLKGVLFFDETDGIFKILDKQSNSVLDPSSTNISPEERRTLYDQSRCFGSNQPQACDAAALLFTSKRNTMAEIRQGSGRMRQIHKGQTVEIGIPDEMVEQRSIEDLLVYWNANQIEKEAFLNFNAEVQQYSNLLRRELLDTMLKAGDLSKVQRIFKANRQLFISKETFSPYQQYARTLRSVATKTALEQKKNQVLSQIKNAVGLTTAQIKKLIEQINLQAQKIVLLPDTVAGGSDIGMECEVLQEVEVEVELEIENKSAVKHESIFRHPIQWNENLNLFKKGWEGTGSLYPLFKRTIGFFIDRLPGSLLDETIIFSRNLQAPKEELLYSIGAVVLGSIVFKTTIVALLVLETIKTTFLIYNVVLFVLTGLIGFLSLGAFFITAAASFFLINAAIVYPTDKIATYINRKFHMDNFISRVDEIMQMHLKNDYPAHKMFPSNLYATNNFYQQSSYESKKKIKTKTGTEFEETIIISPQCPLDIHQKPIFEIMLIEDKGWFGRKYLKGVIIDKNDSIFFRKKLQEDAKIKASDAAKRTRKVAIYDPVNELIVAQGKNTLSLDELKKRPEFHALLASVKFLNGEIKYTDDELAYLKKRVKSIGQKLVQKFFINKILSPFQPKKLDCLKSQKNSELYKLLTVA